MNYFYARVSSKTQNLDRQIDAVEKWKREHNEKIHEMFVDKESGKDFDRKNYQRLRGIIKEGDLLIIKSIDRLGRNYDMIIEEWSYLTKTIKCDILVLDLPSLLDTRTKENGLTGKFIADMVLQILSYVSQTERENTRQRQAEGIKIALEKGVKFGVDTKIPLELWEEIKTEYENGSDLLKVSKNYGITRIAIYKMAQRKGWKRGILNYESKGRNQYFAKKWDKEKEKQC